jgi:hypothetical protein
MRTDFAAGALVGLIQALVSEVGSYGRKVGGGWGRGIPFVLG